MNVPIEIDKLFPFVFIHPLRKPNIPQYFFFSSFAALLFLNPFTISWRMGKNKNRVMCQEDVFVLCFIKYQSTFSLLVELYGDYIEIYDYFIINLMKSVMKSKTYPIKHL